MRVSLIVVKPFRHCESRSDVAIYTLFLFRLRNNRADAFTAKRHDDSCLCEHVVGCVAAVVQRGLRIVIVFSHENFGDAGKADVERATFARKSDHIELGAGRHLAASVVERVDFGVNHEWVLVGFEFVMADERT